MYKSVAIKLYRIGPGSKNLKNLASGGRFIESVAMKELSRNK
jgi:hypothetical protein